MRYLQHFQPEDADVIVSWVHSPQELFLWSGGCLPLKKPCGEDLRRLVRGEGYDLEPWQRLHPVCLWENGKLTGFFAFCPVSEKAFAQRLGLVIVAPEARGRGLGLWMVHQALGYAFEHLHAQQVVLGVFAENAPARQCYLAAGFRPSGPPSFHQVGGSQWSHQPMSCRKGQDRDVERQALSFL